jgi:hypothetical protein
MSNYYVYQRLEDLAHELNPSLVKPTPLHASKVEAICEEIRSEKQSVQAALQQLFYQNNEDEATSQLIRKSHHALVLLVNRAFETRNHDMAHRMNVIKPLDELMHCLEHVLHWFHENFNRYLTPEQPYPITKLKIIRSSILEKKETVKEILKNAGNHDEAIFVLVNALEEFVAQIDRGEAITKHEADYHKELLKDIERSNGHSHVVSNCPPLHELLVYWNLNSKEAISYFTKGLEEIIGSYPNANERLEYLRLQYKYVQQMPQLPGFTYNLRYPSIKDYFCDYLNNEIEHLEKKTAGFLPSSPPAAEADKAPFKVTTSLSVDQLGLFFRACIAEGILKGRSVNSIFKFLFPFISTSRQEDISPDSARTKSYAAEERDKEILIAVLEKIIEFLKKQ